MWTLFYRNLLSREEKTDLSAPDKVTDCSLYPVTYLLPLKERPDWGKKAAGNREKKVSSSTLASFKDLFNRRHPKCIARAGRCVISYSAICSYYPAKRIFQYCSGYWWVIVHSGEYQDACREYLFTNCELSMHSPAIPRFLNNRTARQQLEYFNLYIACAPIADYFFLF